jgi:hypothetical protein
MLAAVSMRDGNTVASTSFELPGRSKPSLRCEVSDFSAPIVSPAWMRTMFDRAFRRMAVTVTDEATDAKQASTVDVTTGKQALLPSASKGFASTPKEEGAVFHPTTEDLWFVDKGTYQVESRDPSSGRTTLHGKLPGNHATDLAVGVKGYFPIESLQIAVVAPDGKHAVVDGPGGEAFLAPVGKLPDEAPRIGDNATWGSNLPGAAAYCGTAETWLDDQNLLCDNSTMSESKLSLITFAPDRTSITQSRADLLPDTNRRNFFEVASPDGKSFAFLSLQGHLVTLYRQSLAPGSVPIKVVEVKPPAMMADAAAQGLVPVLLVWQ